jgi:molecular chaperone IbpA
MNKITTKNLPAFFDSRGIGFGRVFDMLNDFNAYGDQPAYPPYNVLETDADHYVIELALAGFTAEDLEITQDRNKLKIVGRKLSDVEESTVKYLHRGISQRAFTREFVLADYVTVEGAEFADGIVSIKLLRELPEEVKPRLIEVKSIAAK